MTIFINNLLEAFIPVYPLTTTIFVIDLLRYIVSAGLVFIFLYVWKNNPFKFRKIQNKENSPNQFKKEILYSISSVCVYTVVTLVVLTFKNLGFFKFYNDIEKYGMLYLLFSIVLILIVQDFYFYVTHRTMHLKPFYKLMHKVHHESTTPSPWTAYSFHPLEALIHALIFPITALLFPIHPIASLVFMTFQILRNVIGHSGYEFFPNWFLHTPILKLIVSNTHHDLHHQTFKYNFSLYCNIWDRIFGTMYEKTDLIFEEITTREKVGIHK